MTGRVLATTKFNKLEELDFVSPNTKSQDYDSSGPTVNIFNTLRISLFRYSESVYGAFMHKIGCYDS